ncbi:MAG TPA: LytR C-terminal domain-containing protein [Gaiellaceae bacterium]|nr:LytR C-terminal domain-containing protein [Gaiellaceae bacterium]
MDAPLTPADALIRPWRLATLAASLIAGVELIVLVLLAFLLLAKPLSHAIQRHATATATAAVVKKAQAASTHKLIKPPPVGVAKLTRAHTSVLVLNGNGRSGVAHIEAAKLQHLGYRVGGAANAKRSDYATSVVMFRNGYAAEGNRLAHDLHVSVVGPLDGMKPAALHGSQVVIVLGAR